MATRFHIQGRTMKKTMVRLLAAAMVSLGLSACGGGGGNEPQASTQSVVTGVSGMVQGHAAGATVTVSTVSGTGLRQTLATTVTDGRGGYSTTVRPANGDVVLVEVQGGQYTNIYTGAQQPLSVPLRAVAVWQSASDRIAVSAYTEMVVRSLAEPAVAASAGRAATSGTWGSVNVEAVRQRLARRIGAPELSNLDLPDLGQSVPDGISYEAYAMGIEVGGFDVFMGKTAASQLAVALDKLYQLLVNDFNDDTLRPAYFAGLAAYADHTRLSTQTKFDLKSWALLRSQGTTEQSLVDAVPTGGASGGGTATMPFDGLVMLHAAGQANVADVDAYFNTRGALTAYQLTRQPSVYRYLHTASVGEVVADGELAIGRWHGGVVGLDNWDDAGNLLSSTYSVLAPGDGLYAIGLPATGLPVCGLRSLSVLGQTRDSLSHNPALSGLSGVLAQSTYGLQFVGGQARLRLNLALQTTTGETLSFVASDLPLGDDGQMDLSVASTQTLGTLPIASVRIKGLLVGEGARKLLMRVQLTAMNHQPTEWAVALTGSTVLDTSGCTALAAAAALTPP
jgi:hypothetical protein